MDSSTQTPREKLTKKQQEVYDFIVSSMKEHGIAPTIRDIARGLELSSPSTVHVHLANLETKGYIHRDPLKSRCMTVLHEEDLMQPGQPASIHETDSGFGSVGTGGFSNIVTLPVVGNVAAGQPILAEQNITETIPLPTEIVGDGSSFLLQVRGESMIEIGINDGDFVVVQEQPTARNGDVVVAIIDDGATVKTYYRERDYIRLQPENSAMEPIIVRDDVSIAGKVVALFRRM